MLLYLVGVAVPIDCQCMYFVLFCQGWNDVLGYSPKARFYTCIATE